MWIGYHSSGSATHASFMMEYTYLSHDPIYTYTYTCTHHHTSYRKWHTKTWFILFKIKVKSNLKIFKSKYEISYNGIAR